MPIYEYACQDCGHNFEKLQRISDDPVRDCPSCEAEGTVKKLVSQTSFVLKGGGWYSDHYGLKGGGGESSSTESSASESTAPSSGASSSASSSGSGASGDGSTSAGSSGGSTSSDSGE